jgi:hypothetical protein
MSASPVSELQLRVVIPHFFREGAQVEVGGFGSSRHGNRLVRGIDLSHCLASVLSLNRAPSDLILNIAE